ncbi:MAG: hypothetical protein D6800_06765 [Candidatus Zixiibacteriota bacterium]|nr:MAG: hypothetical protein D6800_06765 [candidate division Zixibacteria bacterium]
MAHWKLICDEDGQPREVEWNGNSWSIVDSHLVDLLPEDFSKVADQAEVVDSAAIEVEDSEGSVVVEIEATHAGYVNGNGYFYTAEAMRAAVETWTRPFPKPYLVNHDRLSDPLGRVIDAEYVPTSKSRGYILLKVRIGDEEEIKRIQDGRALTVSTGARATEMVECSVCGRDLLNNGTGPQRYRLKSAPDSSWMTRPAPGFFGEIGMTNAEFWDVSEDDKGRWTAECRHIRMFEAPMGGDVLKKTYYIFHGLDYQEVSRVNVPADVNQETGEYAHIRGVVEDKSDKAKTPPEDARSDAEDIFDMSPTEFGSWLRAQSDLSPRDRVALERLYIQFANFLTHNKSV